MEIEDEISMFVNDQTGCYLESLIRCKSVLKKSEMLNKLDEVIMAELDLALLAAEKAKSEILKQNKKEDTVRPIK